MPEAEPLVEVKNLYKIFGPDPDEAYRLLGEGLSKDEIFERTGMTVGVRDANFDVYKGEVFVVMGLSGSGKSTLIRMLNRLIEPTYGSVLINGEDVTRMDNKELIALRRQKMSMVFQSFALMPHLTVWENAAFGLDVAGIDKDQRKERAMGALEQVGLKANAYSYPDELSGGMQQRVGLARGLAVDPTIMLMDEAFSALDPLIRTEMQDELVRLQSEQARTVVFISHDLDEAMRIGDRIAIMEGGRIVQVGTPDEILHYPADDYVQSFFRGVDVSNIFKAGDIARKDQLTLIYHEAKSVRSALKQLHDYSRHWAYVRDKGNHLLGVVSVESLLELERKGGEPAIEEAYLDVEPISPDTSLDDLLHITTQYACPVPVVDDHGKYLGTVSKTTLLETLGKAA